MKMLQSLCYVVGISQLILGGLFLFFPAFFMAWIGLEVPPQGSNYILAMLSARLLVYGFGMFIIARRPRAHRFWIDGMIGIQGIDLAAGVLYTATGVVALSVSAFPTSNAFLFVVLLGLLRRQAAPVADNA